jgi:hypothetical protein
MARCYGCSQENCGFGPCVCSCHEDDRRDEARKEVARREAVKAEAAKIEAEEQQAKVSNSPMYCGHANESGLNCQCPTYCYCYMKGNCKPGRLYTREEVEKLVEAARMLPSTTDEQKAKVSKAVETHIEVVWKVMSLVTGQYWKSYAEQTNGRIFTDGAAAEQRVEMEHKKDPGARWVVVPFQLVAQRPCGERLGPKQPGKTRKRCMLPRGHTHSYHFHFEPRWPEYDEPSKKGRG